MFTPHYIEFKGFVVIGTNFFFLETHKDSDIIGNSEENHTHMYKYYYVLNLCLFLQKLG